MKATTPKAKPNALAIEVLPALKRAAKVARKTAKMYGTPIWISRNGKIVAVKP